MDTLVWSNGRRACCEGPVAKECFCKLGCSVCCVRLDFVSTRVVTEAEVDNELRPVVAANLQCWYGASDRKSVEIHCMGSCVPLLDDSQYPDRWQVTVFACLEGWCERAGLQIGLSNTFRDVLHETSESMLVDVSGHGRCGTATEPDVFWFWAGQCVQAARAHPCDATAFSFGTAWSVVSALRRRQGAAVPVGR